MAGDARERPIIFSAPMVRAILDGRKTMTRRIIKPQPSAGVRVSPFVSSGLEDGHGREVRIPWRPGDRAWVRETHYVQSAGCRDGGGRVILYRAAEPDAPCTWRSPIHMPRWASRITLEITDVRVQRLQDISEEDAVAEGIGPAPGGWWSGAEGQSAPDPRAAFALLWSGIHGADAWDRNPWVAKIGFTRCLPSVEGEKA